MPIVELLDSWLLSLGPSAYLALFCAALIEYVFPPFPGDSVVLLGGVFAVRGDASWPLVLLTVTAGSVLGCAVNYAIGVKLGDRYEHKFPVVRERMRQRGMWLIAFNRFMPGVRGPLFLVAGASRMPFAKVMVWGAFSALLWNALILSLGVALGGNAERLERFLRDYNRAAVAVIAVVMIAVLAKLTMRFVRSRRSLERLP